VHDSTVTVANMVSSSTPRLMRLDRLFSMAQRRRPCLMGNKLDARVCASSVWRRGRWM
jgi:hypothetical protein